MRKRLSMQARQELKDSLTTSTANYKDIAEMQGISLSAVYYWAKRFKAKAARKKLAKTAPKTMLRRSFEMAPNTGLYYSAAAKFFDSIYRGPR